LCQYPSHAVIIFFCFLCNPSLGESVPRERARASFELGELSLASRKQTFESVIQSRQNSSRARTHRPHARRTNARAHRVASVERRARRARAQTTPAPTHDDHSGVAHHVRGVVTKRRHHRRRPRTDGRSRARIRRRVVLRRSVRHPNARVAEREGARDECAQLIWTDERRRAKSEERDAADE